MEGGAKIPGVGELMADGVAAATLATTVEVARGARYLGRLLGWDETLLLGMRRFRAPWRTRLARGLTRAGDGWTWAAAGGALLGAGLLSGSRPLTRFALRMNAATAIAAVGSQALKRSLSRRRPTIAIEGFTALAENPDAFSFPSGHTTAAVAVAVAVQGENRATGPLFLLLAAGIGLSRVYLGAHYPLDVAVGAVLGAGSGVASRMLVP